MKEARHGLTFGIERIDSDFFLSLKATGKLTHEDYQTITPMIERALEGVDEPSMNMFIDASELEGWEIRAAWDDLKLGLKHGSEFNKIAIFGNKKWQEFAAKIGSWFTSGEIRFFEDSGAALLWFDEV